MIHSVEGRPLFVLNTSQNGTLNLYKLYNSIMLWFIQVDRASKEWKKVRTQFTIGRRRSLTGLAIPRAGIIHCKGFRIRALRRKHSSISWTKLHSCAALHHGERASFPSGSSQPYHRLIAIHLKHWSNKFSLGPLSVVGESYPKWATDSRTL
jgi:hypothetical protein